MKVYVYRDGTMCPYEWAEVASGLPVHPGDLRHRISDLILRGEPFATQSDIVISILGWMVRHKQLPLPTSIVYVGKDGVKQDENPFDTRGDLVHPWPELGFESILECGFYHRFD